MDALEEFPVADELPLVGAEELQGVQASPEVALHGLAQIHQILPVHLEALRLANLSEALGQVQRAGLPECDHLGNQTKGLQSRCISTRNEAPN